MFRQIQHQLHSGKAKFDDFWICRIKKFGFKVHKFCGCEHSLFGTIRCWLSVAHLSFFIEFPLPGLLSDSPPKSTEWPSHSCGTMNIYEGVFLLFNLLVCTELGSCHHQLFTTAFQIITQCTFLACTFRYSHSDVKNLKWSNRLMPRTS